MASGNITLTVLPFGGKGFDFWRLMSQWLLISKACHVREMNVFKDQSWALTTLIVCVWRHSALFTMLEWSMAKCSMFPFQSGNTIDSILLEFKSARVKEAIKSTFVTNECVAEAALFYWPV